MVRSPLPVIARGIAPKQSREINRSRLEQRLPRFARNDNVDSFIKLMLS
jgi:hypothetical protein